MNHEYLIIWCTSSGDYNYYFLENEDELRDQMAIRKTRGQEITFAGKINVIKDFME
jgi:hypothetical protein